MVSFFYLLVCNIKYQEEAILKISHMYYLSVHCKLHTQIQTSQNDHFNMITSKFVFNWFKPSKSLNIQNSHSKKSSLIRNSQLQTNIFIAYKKISKFKFFFLLLTFFAYLNTYRHYLFLSYGQVNCTHINFIFISLVFLISLYLYIF